MQADNPLLHCPRALSSPVSESSTAPLAPPKRANNEGEITPILFLIKQLSYPHPQQPMRVRTKTVVVAPTAEELKMLAVLRAMPKHRRKLVVDIVEQFSLKLERCESRWAQLLYGHCSG